MVNEHALTHVEFRDSLIRMENRLDQRMDGMQQRMDARFDRLEDKFSRLFTWTIGIQLTVLVTVIGSLVGLGAILAPR